MTNTVNTINTVNIENIEDISTRRDLLAVRKLGIRFGGLQAVTEFDLDLVPGGLYGIIGPNGAGKTTVFNMLTGIYRPTEGRIVFKSRDWPEGKDMIGEKIHSFTAAGIARTFQNVRLFKNLTVLENIEIALHRNVRYGLASAFFRTPAMRRREEEVRDEAAALLERLGLLPHAGKKASGLPYGLQRRLEIARALATSPTLLLLDEPAAGMNPQEVDRLAEDIQWLKEEFGLTVLLIEHHMALVMRICRHITVMNFGRTIADGPPDAIRNDRAVIEAYLGKGGKF
ncbi:MAG: ABC transporter ATP-binding protein [Synergistaceae bacterium]|jgi:branched-chain amino acid transport system ATP-binding protein|nr:ABC transporter ATP-binding protein [Synergistaceae bacterium]